MANMIVCMALYYTTEKRVKPDFFVSWSIQPFCAKVIKVFFGDRWMIIKSLEYPDLISQRFFPKQVVQMATFADKYDWLFHKQQYDVTGTQRYTYKSVLNCDLYNIHVMWSFPDEQVINESFSCQ